MSDVILNFDGSIWPKNPGGHAGWGFALSLPDKPLIRRCGYIGFGDHMTNNVAEYYGLIQGMAKALSQGVRYLTVRGDSQLVIRHMSGEYQCRAELLIPLYKAANELSRRFTKVVFEWDRREQNCDADDLSKYGVLMRLDKYFIELNKFGHDSLWLTVSNGIVVEPEKCVLLGDSSNTVMEKVDNSGYTWKIIK